MRRHPAQALRRTSRHAFSPGASCRLTTPERRCRRKRCRALRRGIEKESLRVRPDGTLATTPHPAALGSALTHPHITTDFSESQLELITGVHAERATRASTS